LLAVDGRGVFCATGEKQARHDYGLRAEMRGKIFLCPANPGKVVTLGAEYE